MSAREHILDFFAAVDIPLRNIVLVHCILHLGLKSLAFSDALHRFKRQRGFSAVCNEIVHNIVACAYNLHQRCGAVPHKILRIIKPHIRAVGKSGDTNKLFHCCRTRIHQHSANKVRSEFGNAEAADIAFQLLKGYSEYLIRFKD